MGNKAPIVNDHEQWYIQHGFSEISTKVGNKKPLGEDTKRAKRVLKFIAQLRSSGCASWGTLKSLSFMCEDCHSADAPTCQKAIF